MTVQLVSELPIQCEMKLRHLTLAKKQLHKNKLYVKLLKTPQLMLAKV